MKFSLIASVAALTASAFAAPAPAEELDKRTFFCVSQQQAEKYVSRFTGILNHQGSDLGDYLATADKLLAPKFQEISDSINSLAGFPLGSVTTPSKEAYIGGIQHAPADNGVETIFVTVANCKDIVWRWNIKGVGSSQYPVKGFNYFKMQQQFNLNVPWVATELQIEFNSIAWGLDTGYGFVLQNGTVLGKQPAECTS